jgi:hypothetical protein
MDDTEKPKCDEEHELAPLGLDPSMSSVLCPFCRAQCLDLGKETGDRYRLSRTWYKCEECNNLHSEIIGKI